MRDELKEMLEARVKEEHADHEAYMKLAEQMENKADRALIQCIAKEEGSHAHWLKKILHRM